MPTPSEPNPCPRCGCTDWDWSDHGVDLRAQMAWECRGCGSVYGDAATVERERRKIESEREMAEDAA